jgi:TetR/AcrR family transcriptional regulator
MRRALLEAALEAFAARGYDATSVRDLARQVGVSHNLVHHHYGSKRALWQAALGHAVASSGRELLALVVASEGQRDWEVANRDGIVGALMLFARQPAVAKIMADESARGGERLDFLYARHIAPFARLLERLLDGAPAHVKRRIDARAALLFLFAGMTAPFALGGLAAKLDGTPTLTDDDLQRFAATVAEIIAHGLSPARRTPQRRVKRSTTGGS